MFRLFTPLLAVLVLAAAGCSSSNEPPVYPIHGKVKYKESALKFGQITFVHESGRPYTADLSSDGSYKVSAAAGKCQVAITCLEAVPPSNGRGKGKEKSLIPEKYTAPTTSGLSFEVKPSNDNAADFGL